MGFDVPIAYHAISHAETGGEKNPFIRTKVKDAPGGSTAFGPTQITGKLAEGAHKAGYLKKSKDFYEKEMKPRYEKMKYHGNNKGKVKDYNPRYDYGGDAEFDSKKHSENYRVFSEEIMSGVGKEAKDDENKFIEKWRGKSEKDDPGYYKKYREAKSSKELGDEMKRQLER